MPSLTACSRITIRSAVQDQVADGVRENKKFVDAEPALVSALTADGATHGTLQGQRFVGGWDESQPLDFSQGRLKGFVAFQAQFPGQSLREDSHHG